MNISPDIFRAYDIRGIVDKTLTETIVFCIGQAIGTSSLQTGEKTVVVGRDGRLSGPRLITQLSAGIAATGCDVVDLGEVPTPLVYFAASTLNIKTAVMLTGSHNPPDYNGLKILLNGKAIYGQEIQALRQSIVDDNFAKGNGQQRIVPIVADYIKYIKNDLNLQKSLKVVVDCGNGVAGNVVQKLYSALGCEVIPLFCDVDGNFPNHHPDPGDPKNLTTLQETVQQKQADIGLAFDGDGDRLGVIDSQGKIIWPDRYLMLLAQEVLQKKPGTTIIYDVKSTKNLESIIQAAGGTPLMWKTGHSLIKAKMRETSAILAGEMSGHVFFQDRWFGFDDALYAGARILEILSRKVESSADIFSQFPELISTPEIQINVTEANKFTIIEQLKSTTHFKFAQKIITIDGIRAEFEDGWGLIRSSNTTPKLVARFEAKHTNALEHIQAMFKQALLEVAPDIELPF